MSSTASAKKRKGGGRGDVSSSFPKKQKFDSYKKHKNSKTNSADDHAASSSSTSKKRALKHERQSHRRHADVVASSKDLWNKLRLKTNTPFITKSLMADLMNLIRGRMNDIAMQHDASRVVQAAIQFGTKEQRAEIVEELCGKEGHLVELSKVQYAHFVVLKMIKYCGREEGSVRLMVKALKGHIPKLAVHSVAARVVEQLFLGFRPKYVAPLKEELYGPQFALFADTDMEPPAQRTLSAHLERKPTQKTAALVHVLKILNSGIEKSLFQFAYYQNLFGEYISVASSNDVRSLASSVVDHSVHLLSTRNGSIVVAALASYGTPKDRKRIMKSMKGYVRTSLVHRDAYVAILRLLDVTDDTVSMHKGILAEVLSDPDDKPWDKKQTGGDKEKEQKVAPEKPSPLLELAVSDTGSKLFLMLLPNDEETRRKYMDPFELDVLSPHPTITENGEEVRTSKKNADTRRRELAQYLRHPLREMCVRHANVLLRSKSGSKVLREVWRSVGRDEEMVNAVVEACVMDDSVGQEGVDDDDKGENKGVLPVFEDPISHLAIKNLLLLESADDSEKETEAKDSCSFADAFYERFGSNLMGIASSNRGAFVLTALAKVPSVRVDVVRQLKGHEEEIRQLSNGGETDDGKGRKKARAGYAALLREMEDEKVQAKS